MIFDKTQFCNLQVKFKNGDIDDYPVDVVNHFYTNEEYDLVDLVSMQVENRTSWTRAWLRDNPIGQHSTTIEIENRQ